MSGSNTGWFWTPEKLKKLQTIIHGAAERDEEGFYFGIVGLTSYVIENRKEDLDAGGSQIGNGIKILVFLNVLEPGKPGVKLPGYKRRYYPENAESITQADVDKYRQRKS